MAPSLARYCGLREVQLLQPLVSSWSLVFVYLCVPRGFGASGGLGSPRTVVTGVCKLPYVNARNQIGLVGEQ